MSTLYKQASIKISELNFDEILIPEILINQGEHYRIELGISHHSKIGLLRRILEKESSIQNVATFKTLKENNRIETLLFSTTIEGYFLKNNISLEKIESLIENYNLNSYQKVRKETKLKHLPEQELRFFKIFILMQSHKKIFIDTGGMYVSVLIMTYKLIRDFLECGGIVIELAYPHFSENSEYDPFTTKNMRTIKVGEMRILQ